MIFAGIYKMQIFFNTKEILYLSEDFFLKFSTIRKIIRQYIITEQILNKMIKESSHEVHFSTYIFIKFYPVWLQKMK